MSCRSIKGLSFQATLSAKRLCMTNFAVFAKIFVGSYFGKGIDWTKPTFGANGWGDYFALLALGFGAEATRNVVTQVARKADESSS